MTVFALGNVYSAHGLYDTARVHHQCACHMVSSFEVSCLAAQLDLCYAKRDIPQDVVDTEFRVKVIPTCTIEKCQESGNFSVQES